MTLGGYYCTEGSSSPVACEYPYYCPRESSFKRLCKLGYFSLTRNKPRENHTQSCQICPAGTYGNEEKRLNCTECPSGYFCPAGTIGPHQNPCPKGYYCPLNSGDKYPCPAGSYGNRSLATSPSDCYLCPNDTFNNVAGRTACRPCGSSSTAGKGQAKCTCIGINRAFQISDGSCQCKSGYVYYDEADLSKSEGNSDNDCQPEVNLRISLSLLFFPFPPLDSSACVTWVYVFSLALRVFLLVLGFCFSAIINMWVEGSVL